MHDNIERYRLHARVLCPLHIGTGEEISRLELLPDKNEDGCYYRVRPEDILMHLDPEALKEWEIASRNLDFVSLRNVLINNCKGPSKTSPGNTRYAVQSWGKFAQEYGGKAGSNEGEYEVLETQRNADGSLCIPGSSLKGAIRTAIVSEAEKRKKIERQDRRKPNALEARILGNGKVDRKTGQLRLDQFGDPQPDIDRDPFRALTVRDATIPASAARLVSARNRSLKRDDALNNGIPMQLEVVSGLALDPQNPVEFTTEITLNKRIQETIKGECRSKRIEPPLEITAQGILTDCAFFYGHRLGEEWKRFYQEPSWKLLEPTLGGVLQLKKNGAGQPLEFFLRLGRFSHVECLTIENHRQVQAPPRGNRNLRRTEGSARTLVDGTIPFGWLACRLEAIKD